MGRRGRTPHRLRNRIDKYIQAMLFNTSPLDPSNLAAVSALFLAVALAACFVPAWRAAQVDPITALRQE